MFFRTPLEGCAVNGPSRWDATFAIYSLENCTHGFWSQTTWNKCGIYFALVKRLVVNGCENSLRPPAPSPWAGHRPRPRLQVIGRVRALAERSFPAVKEAKFVEWWAHRRPHSSGHQMHFDSDNEGRGGVRNPIVRYVNGLASYVSNTGIFAKSVAVKVAPAFYSKVHVMYVLCSSRCEVATTPVDNTLAPIDEQPSRNAPP